MFKSNVGIVDRILRVMVIHLAISLVDWSVLQSIELKFFLSIIVLYLVFTIVTGVDFIYRFIGWDTKETTKVKL